MYVPSHFAEADLPTLHAFIERYSFGLLVSQVDGMPFANHLPFLLDRTAGSHGALIGHMARANPQWRDAAGLSTGACCDWQPMRSTASADRAARTSVILQDEIEL